MSDFDYNRELERIYEEHLAEIDRIFAVTKMDRIVYGFEGAYLICALGYLGFCLLRLLI